MVSDIYFPIPPSPYPAFYPISYPLNLYPQPTPRQFPSSHSMPIYAKPKSMKRHEQVIDANRNHIVPYYYSDTMNCMPNNLNNRHTFANYPCNDQNTRFKMSPRLQTRLASPELAHIFNNTNIQPQQFRPYSVMETCKSPIPVSRPLSVVPMSDAQFRPASTFFQKEVDQIKEIPNWKARLQNDFGPKPNMFRSRPLRQICRIPNCKCSDRVNRMPGQYSESKTLPMQSERNLAKIRNLSLPSLKLEETVSKEKHNKSEAERDVTSNMNKSITEQHLGYV